MKTFVCAIFLLENRVFGLHTSVFLAKCMSLTLRIVILSAKNMLFLFSTVVFSIKDVFLAFCISVCVSKSMFLSECIAKCAVKSPSEAFLFNCGRFKSMFCVHPSLKTDPWSRLFFGFVTERVAITSRFNVTNIRFILK